MIGKDFVKHLDVALLPGILFFSLAALTSAATVTGGTTVVTLDSATVTALTGLGFSLAPVAPATLGGTPLAATFPITGGDSTSAIDHSGGLAFTLGSTTADIENFVINLSGPDANIITGELVAGASMVNGVKLFDIGTGLTLTLDSQIAGDLSSAFDVPNLTGASIGTAAVNAVTATPEPTSMALAGFGMMAAALVSRRGLRRVRKTAEV